MTPDDRELPVLPRLLARVLPRLPYAFWVLAPDGAFRLANPSTREVLGWNPSALLGYTLGDLLHPDDLAACRT